jgi:organic hydroperoxide reductase OsmC/OhrA
MAGGGLSVPKTHSYHARIVWTGNLGSGTSGYRAYGRDCEVTVPVPDETEGAHGAAHPAPIAGSSDPAFRGDPGRWNPEQLLVAALSQCHMLSYLHLCAVAGVVVTEYTDDAWGSMTQTADGGGQFTEVVLRPQVTVSSPEMAAKAAELHEPAHEKCFIASSVRFPVRSDPPAPRCQGPSGPEPR